MGLLWVFPSFSSNWIYYSECQCFHYYWANVQICFRTIPCLKLLNMLSVYRHQPGKKYLLGHTTVGAVRHRAMHSWHSATHHRYVTELWIMLKAEDQALNHSPWKPKSSKPKPSKIMSVISPTSRFEMSIRTAKLVIWLHWQAIWLWFLENSSHPLEDQAPVPPILRGKKACLRGALSSPRAFHCYCSLGDSSCSIIREDGKYQDRNIYSCYLPEGVSST